MSQSDEPRLRKFENDSWPGVSMTRRPGSFRRGARGSAPMMASTYFRSVVFDDARCVATGSILSRSVALSKNVAPICCVMPPASPSWTFVWRILSRSFVLPVSTWPMMQQMGDRRRSSDRSASRRFSRARRFWRHSSFLSSASRSALSAAAACSASNASRASCSAFFFASRSFNALPAAFRRSASALASSSAPSSSSSSTARLADPSFSKFAARSPVSQSSASSQSSAASASGAGGAGSGSGSGSGSSSGGGGASSFFFSGFFLTGRAMRDDPPPPPPPLGRNPFRSSATSDEVSPMHGRYDSGPRGRYDSGSRGAGGGRYDSGPHGAGSDGGAGGDGGENPFRAPPPYPVRGAYPSADDHGDAYAAAPPPNPYRDPYADREREDYEDALARSRGEPPRRGRSAEPVGTEEWHRQQLARELDL
mmetsp:Transcript_5462/g.17240  ORF Transcript_5462/g.17240 Transcript_5462/m.17240 type:complete len:423 (-) Transcript_5462:49-1317(-)